MPSIAMVSLVHSFRQQVQASLATRCLIDTFQVTNPGGPTPPTICGTNSGEHMYVESSAQCNVLDFAFGNEVIKLPEKYDNIFLKNVVSELNALNCYT